MPIYSTVDNFEKRKLLRESLGRLAEKLGCRIFFIVGMSGNIETNKRLLDEYILEKDILVIGKIDTYRYGEPNWSKHIMEGHHRILDEVRKNRFS